MLHLILAAALTAQCPGGVCPNPSMAAYGAYRYSVSAPVYQAAPAPVYYAAPVAAPAIRQAAYPWYGYARYPYAPPAAPYYAPAAPVYQPAAPTCVNGQCYRR